MDLNNGFEHRYRSKHFHIYSNLSRTFCSSPRWFPSPALPGNISGEPWEGALGAPRGCARVWGRSWCPMFLLREGQALLPRQILGQQRICVFSPPINQNFTFPGSHRVTEWAGLEGASKIFSFSWAGTVPLGHFMERETSAPQM